MKLINVVVFIAIFSVISFGFGSSVSDCRKLDQKYFELAEKKNSKEFITESFINTCKGSGFADLNEWQSFCREMFNLEYIAWSNANEFMDVSMSESNEDLFYGVWKNNEKINEVYCRKRRF